MIVVADTTPVNYLILIGEVHVLQKLFGRVLIPSAVWNELQRERTPEAVRQWMVNPPEWLEVRAPSKPFQDQLLELDDGEREAIALADELNADVLLLDEIVARRKTSQRPYRVMGTLGVLGDAAEAGLVDLPKALARLQQTTFRAARSFTRPRLSAMLRGK